MFIWLALTTLAGGAIQPMEPTAPSQLPPAVVATWSVAPGDEWLCVLYPRLCSRVGMH